MKYTEISHFKDGQFKRFVGVTRLIFDLMVTYLKEKIKNRKHPSRGVKSKLSVEDELLIKLMYYRKYRTFFM